MNIFKHRPLSLFCALFVACFAIFASFSFLDEGIFAIFFIFAALCLVLTLIFGKKHRRPFAIALVCLIFALLGVLYSYFACELRLERVEKAYAGKECSVSGYVIDEGALTSYSSSYYVKVEKISGRSVNFKARVDLDFADYFHEGDKIEFSGVGMGFEDDIFGYPERKMMFSEGYSLAFDVSEGNIKILDGKVDSVSMFFDKLNRKLCARVSYRLPGTEGDLVNALLLGNKNGLEPWIQRDFSRSGVAHLLALSGLHTGIIIGFLDLLLRKLHFPKYPRVALVLLCAFSYLALTGFAASTIRAVLMMTFVYLAFVFFANADGLTSLFVSGTLILLISPYSVFDAGFWMSFAATFGILVFAPMLIGACRRLCDRIKLKVLSKSIFWVLSSLGVSVCAMAFIVICSMLYFGEISPVAPLSTLVLSPVTVLFLIFSIIAVAFMRVPIIFAPAKIVIGLLTEIYVGVTSYVSSFRGAVVSLKYEFAVWLVTVATLLLAVFVVIRLKRKWVISLIPLGFAACFALCLGIHGALNSSKLGFDYVRYSNSESVVLHDDKKAMLIDFSDGSYTAIRAASREVSENCITELEAIVLTHYHKKHSYSVGRMMDVAMVRSLWLPTPQNESDYYVFSALYKRAENSGVRVVIYDYGTPLTVFNSSTLAFFKDYIERSTHPVLSMCFENESARITYLGSSANELEDARETLVLARRSNAVIFGAHGPIVKSDVELDSISAECDIVFAANADLAEKIKLDDTSKLKIARRVEKISFPKY